MKEYIIKGISPINQYDIGYPTGCESISLAILLNYWGINVSVDDIVTKLKKGDKPYFEDNIRYGGNPYIEFVGHPKDEHSFGVYDKPVEDVANAFKIGIINGSGKSLNEILNIVKENRPVIVWNSMYLKEPFISTSWIYKETGETIKWLANEHAVVIIGFNETHVIACDSLTGNIEYLDRIKFEEYYNMFGKRALYY